MDKRLEKFTEDVLKGISIEITDLLMSKGMPPQLASGILANTLAIYCKTTGLTQHQAIDKFATTVRSIYNQNTAQ
jgi:hypothetical protein